MMRSLQADQIRRAMHRALRQYELSDQHAADVTETLLTTSLRGVDTHGVRLLETYLRELAGGRAKSAPVMELRSTTAATAVLDADGALGVVAANEAIRMAMQRAEEHGVSVIVVKNSNHCGALGYYTELAARSGFLTLAFSNSDALVAPHNGVRPLNGTNPIAMSAPGINGDGFDLDMATSQASFTRVRQYAAAGIRMPPGLAIGSDGEDSNLTGQVHCLQPLGGYKGQALGTMVQILCALLSGMPFDFELSNAYEEPYSVPRNISHCFICLRIDAFTELGKFQERTSALLNVFRGSAPDNAVTVAGDHERRTFDERMQSGIPLSDAEWTLLEPYLNAA